MYLFNEINCRMINGEVCVCKGILNNSLFCIILITTSFLQVLIVQLGGRAFHVKSLSAKFWGLSIFLGFLSLPVQQLINLFYLSLMKIRNSRKGKRYRRNQDLHRHNIVSSSSRNALFDNNSYYSLDS